MTAWSTRMTSAADDSRNDVADDAGVLGEAWRQFAREDAAMTAPPELERKVLAAWEALQHPDRRSHPPGRLRLAWVVGAVASALAVAFALHGDRATPVPVATDSRLEESAIRNSGDAPPPRWMMKRDAILTFTAEPVLETETLQLVRVRMPRLALQAVGVVVSGPNNEGFVEMDLVVGEDGLPKTVRRVALVQ